MDKDNIQRKQAEKFHTDQEAFDYWVERIAFVKHMPLSEVLNLSMVKQEGLTYKGGEDYD